MILVIDIYRGLYVTFLEDLHFLQNTLTTVLNAVTTVPSAVTSVFCRKEVNLLKMPYMDHPPPKKFLQVILLHIERLTFSNRVLGFYNCARHKIEWFESSIIIFSFVFIYLFYKETGLLFPRSASRRCF